MITWKDVKKKGNKDYKSGGVEPIDLFKEGGILWDWCIGEIIAKAYRNRGLIVDMPGPMIQELVGPVNQDLDELIHHAEMLKVVINEVQPKTKK